MQQSHDDMDINFSIMVLGTNFWPLNAPNNDFVIPADIQPTHDRFQKYYQVKHSGRKLTWLWNYSKNELRTNYLNQKYILMTSSYQMAVLLQYNKNDTLSLDELVAATAISKDILTQVLSLLVKAKILINEETEQYDLNPSSFRPFCVYLAFIKNIFRLQVEEDPCQPQLADQGRGQGRVFGCAENCRRGS
jgi:cullin 1